MCRVWFSCVHVHVAVPKKAARCDAFFYLSVHVHCIVNLPVVVGCDTTGVIVHCFVHTRMVQSASIAPALV